MFLRASTVQTSRLLPRRLIRPLHHTSIRQSPYKDDMDRQSLKPKAHEYTASGTDEEVATSHSHASFSPDETSPERAKEMAAQGAAEQGKQNPLEASPADLEFARGGAGNRESNPTPGQSKKSGPGDAPKGRETNRNIPDQNSEP